MRLIDADDFKRRILAFCTACRCTFLSVEGIVAAINNSDTVDAVPVVRCKDCKHYEMGVCLKIYSDGNVSKDAWQRRKPVDFCSYGERKDGGDSDAVD